jgi:NADPH:quinone reductase-like Zn-dependent oxidoreductase
MIKQLRFIYLISITKATKFINYNPGAPESMFIDQRNIEIHPGEVLFKVKALGINRAECLHRQGKYKINRPIEGYLGL